MLATATRPLTKKQKKILRFIVTYWGQWMTSPSIREIASAMEISSPNGVVYHLRALHQKGAIVWESMSMDEQQSKAVARGIIVPELQQAAAAAAKAYLANLKEKK